MHIAYDTNTETIYGTGDTAAAALADAREWSENELRGIVTRAASPELVDVVRATGGYGVRWYVDADGFATLTDDDASRSFGPRVYR